MNFYIVPQVSYQTQQKIKELISSNGRLSHDSTASSDSRRRLSRHSQGSSSRTSVTSEASKKEEHSHWRKNASRRLSRGLTNPMQTSTSVPTGSVELKCKRLSDAQSLTSSFASRKTSAFNYEGVAEMSKLLGPMGKDKGKKRNHSHKRSNTDDAIQRTLMQAPTNQSSFLEKTSHSPSLPPYHCVEDSPVSVLMTFRDVSYGSEMVGPQRLKDDEDESHGRRAPLPQELNAVKDSGATQMLPSFHKGANLEFASSQLTEPCVPLSPCFSDLSSIFSLAEEEKERRRITPTQPKAAKKKQKKKQTVEIISNVPEPPARGFWRFKK